MNLNSNPQVADLAVLFSNCNDKAESHCLWVNKNGDVFADPIPAPMSPLGFQQSKPDMLFRYETFDCGNDYVGVNAASDVKYVTRMFNSLTKEWGNYSGVTMSAPAYIDDF